MSPVGHFSDLIGRVLLSVHAKVDVLGDTVGTTRSTRNALACGKLAEPEHKRSVTSQTRSVRAGKRVSSPPAPVAALLLVHSTEGYSTRS